MNHKKAWAARLCSVMLSGAMVFGMMPLDILAAPEKASTRTVQKGYDGTVRNEYLPAEGGTVYYVDSKDGDDSNNGTSQDTPFKTLEKVNAITLQPGDSILLKRGSIFDDQQLAPKGRGTQDKHILIGAYGEADAMPVINTNFKFREALLIENMEYADITGIEVTNDDVFNETSEAGDKDNKRNTPIVDGKKFRPLGVHILINEDAEGTFKGDGDENRVYKGINLDGCYIHDVDGDENYNTNKLSGGIGIEIKYHNSNGIFPVFDGVMIQNNRIDQVDRCGIKAIRLTELDQNGGNGEEVGGDGERWNGARRQGRNQSSLNYVVRNNYLTDVGGDGILVDSTRGAIVENNLMYNHTMRATGANAGIWSWNAFDTIFQYNESYGGPAYNQDGCSYDSDYNSAGTIFQYNYSHDTPMGFMLIMGGNDTDIVRYNLSQNDGNVWRHIAGNSNTPSYVYNNVFYYNGDNWRFVHNNSDDNSTTQSIKNNWQYFNNIFYNTSEETVSRWKINDWEKAVVGNNMVYEASGKYSQQEIPNAIHADPKFVDPGKGADRSGDKMEVQGNIWSSLDCYQLQEGSPAIGRGAYVNVVPQTTSGNVNCWDYTSDRNVKEDFYGNALYKAAPDIGLEESDKAGADFSIEKNAIYHVMNPESGKYLALTQGSDEVKAADKTKENQGFTIVGSKDGYKVKIWDDTSSAYRYLAAEDGKLRLSETTETVWDIKDLKNGLYNFAADGKNLMCSGEELSLEAGNGEDGKAQWYLELDEHSHSYNVGGEEIEGFSADQKYDESSKQSGSYTENEEFTTEAKDEVYKTGVKGKEIGYKIYASDGEYTLKLYLAEPESDQDRTFDILVNGKTVSDAYVLDKETDELIFTGVYPEDGIIDVKLKSAYNDSGKKLEAVLSGISAEKQVRKEVESRINAGGDGQDGLAADAEYTAASGAGYYGDSTVLSNAAQGVSPDAGIAAAMTTAREGSEFGYKVKAMPGKYRVKLYFAEAEDNHRFDITVNGKEAAKGYNIIEKAGGANKAACVTVETEAVNGLVDVAFTGTDGKKAMVNAVLIEAYDKPSGKKLENVKAAAVSQQEVNPAANAADGNGATRWASEADSEDGQVITFELEEKHILNGIALDWVPAERAKDYHIEVSDDGQEFDTVVMVTDSKPGLNVHHFDSAVGKFVRVVCDARAAEGAISLTEADIFGGAAVAGEAMSTADAEDLEDHTAKVTAGMGYVYKRYSIAEVKYEFDTEKVEYVGNPVYLNEDKLDIVAEMTEEDGTVTSRFGLKKWDGFQSKNNEMVQAEFKNLTDSMTEVNVTVSLTSSDGHVTELPSAKAYIPAKADYALMKALLAEAEELAETAEVGSGRGQYPQESVDALYAAVEQGQACGADSDADQINKAARALYEALELMKDTEINYTKTMYHKDFNNPEETAPQVTAGTGTVADGAWNLSLNANEVAKITDATPLDHGYYYARFKVSNTSDQTLFSILGDDGTKRIRTGWEPSYWFWDDAINGYGSWDGGQNLAAGQDTELMMKFDTTSGNVNYASLWLNGQKINDKTLYYYSGTGLPAFEVRRNGKTFSVEEFYFTDADPVTITVNAGKGGTVSQTGAVTSFKEADKTFYFTPQEGYALKRVAVDGEEVEVTDNSYTFEYLQENHTLDVEFVNESGEEEAQSYHADFFTDTEASFTGAASAVVENQELKLSVTGTGDKQQVVTTAVDNNAPSVSEGTFYTRFRVNSQGIDESADIGKDQVLFDIKKNGEDVIRIGFDYLSPGSSTGNWFYDKAKSGAGWGNFSKGGNVPSLSEDEDHTLRLDFVETGAETYNLYLEVDGKDMGEVTDVKYGGGAGKYGFAARRTTKNYTVKEVYYTNAEEFELTVAGGEHGTLSQTGTLPVFGGTSKTIGITPDEGYKIKSILADGQEVKAEGDRYTFENIQSNHTLSVEFTEATEIPEETVTYHQDYKVDTQASYTGNHVVSSEVKDGVLNLKLEAGKDNDFAIAMDESSPALSQGTFYTRFTPDTIEDQMLFDVRTDGTSDGSAAGYIRLGFEHDPKSGRAAWFYDKAKSGYGYGDFPIQSEPLKAGEEAELKFTFVRNEDGTYNLSLTVNGQDCGTVKNVNYGDGEGKFAFGARRVGRDLSIKEIYYTNAPEYKIHVTANEGGSVSQTGAVTVFGKSSKTLFVTPDEGYEAKAIVNGEDVSLVNNQYTFIDIEADQTFEVMFEEIQTVNKDKLQEIYDLYKDKANEDYTEESWTAFVNALNHAEAVLGDENADQETVDGAVEALKKAAEELIKNPPVESLADMRELQGLLAYNETKEEANYTPESWSKFRMAFAAAETTAGDSQASQEAVDEVRNQLAEAIKALEHTGDISPEFAMLRNFYDANQGRAEDRYDAESWAQYSMAMEKAAEILENPDAAAEEIAAALDGLKAAEEVLNPAPVEPEDIKKPLRALYNKYKDMEQGNYTDESYGALRAALDAANGILEKEDATEDEIAVAERAIEKAVEELAEKPEEKPEVNKDELQKFFNENVNKVESAYTPESWKVFKKALKTADAVLKDKKATQDDVEAALEILKTAVTGLEEAPQPKPEADKSKLQALYNAVEDKEKSDYTAESWKVFKNALKEAEKVLKDKKADEKAIDAAWISLDKAVRGLIKVEDKLEDNKTKLNEIFEKASDKKESDYTAKSWKAFEKALEEAKVVLKDKDAAQKQIDKASNNLEKAMEKLVRK